MSSVFGSQGSRVTAILSFYDEPLELLAASVSSLAGVVDHLVAIDGAYMLYPDAQAASDPEQMRLIEEICRGARIGLTTHTPSHSWTGNEVQKRNHAVALAEPVTSPNGWYYAHDADCVVTSVAGDWFEKLDEISRDRWGAIEISVRETQYLPGIEVDPDASFGSVRLLYRAERGLTYGPAHYVIHVPDPDSSTGASCLWGPPAFNPVEAYDGTHLLKIDHRHERPEYRKLNRRKYYELRERLNVEALGKVMLKNADGSWREHRSLPE